MLDSLMIGADRSARRSPQGVVAPRREGARYTYDVGEHELILTLRDVGDRQVEAVRRGEAEFALLLDDPLILIGARFGDAVPWTFASYCWHLLPRGARALPPASGAPGEARALLHVALVDWGSGQVRAERNVTLWLEFTRALHEAIREQARTVFDPKEHERALARLRRAHPSPEALAARAAHRTIGAP
jgi:hypothetical protein